MPYSLRFVAFLLAAAFMAACASGLGQYLETSKEARLMAEPLAHGNPNVGKADAARYRCGACHSIPGLPGAMGSVGPSLDKMAVRQTIAGRYANTPENLEAWLRHPQELVPDGGMPDQGVTAKDSRDLAAFLYTRR